MSGRPVRPQLTPAERRALERLASDSSRPPRETQRARIVLLSAAGAKDRKIAEQLGTSLPTVTLWRGRYAAAGIEGLQDRPRTGRPRLITGASGGRQVLEGGQRPPSPADGNGAEADDQGVEHLLQAACRTISKRGFASTRVADIAAEAGVSPATVHYHFKTRQEILVEALLWANARLVGELERAGAAGDAALVRMARFLERSVPYPGTQEDEYRLEIDLWGQARHHPALLGPYEAFAKRWENEVVDIIETGVSCGEFKTTVGPLEVAQRLTAFTDGLAAQTVLGSNTMPPERVRELILRLAAEQLGIDAAELDRHAQVPALTRLRKQS